MKRSILFLFVIPLTLLISYQVHSAYSKESIVFSTDRGLSSGNTAVDSNSVYVVAIDQNYVPYEYLDEAGRVRGFTPELLAEIGKSAGVTFLFKPMSWPDAVKGLEDGSIDLVNMIYSSSRTHKYAFSEPHSKIRQALFRHISASDIDSLESLAGHEVGFQLNDISLEVLRHRTDFETHIVQNKEEGFLHLNAGMLDAFFASEKAGIKLIKDYSLTNIEPVLLGLFSQDFCFTTNKGNEELIDLLNQHLKKLKESGRYDEIADKWLANPILEDVWIVRNWKMAVAIASILVLILFISLTVNLILRRAVAKKTEKLELDIIKRKQMERALIDEKEKFQKYLDIAAVMVVMLDVDQRVVLINKKGCDVLGYVVEDIIGKHWFNNFIPENIRAAVKVVFDKLMAGEIEPVDYYENEVLTKKGEVRLIAWYNTVFRDEDGKISNLLSSGADITERKHLDEELHKAHKLESIGFLAGGIAHDFNNILSAILAKIYLARKQLDVNSKAYRDLEVAEKAIDRATNLTMQLLTFSRGGVPIRKTSSIIEIIHESAEFALKGSNVKCKYYEAENIWPVEVDAGQMNQVIHNLILNADQAMPDGGIIRIKTENVELASDKALQLQKGRYVKVAVQDQGTGISEEHLQKLYDPYFTTKEMGRGLGLSITYSIIKRHDGHISVESELGAGTTFTIYLPASEKQVKEKEHEQDTLTCCGGKILLMDDEEMIRESLGEFLAMTGYKVEYAKDGDEAIVSYGKAMKASEPFDAVILDLTVRGGMGGKAAVKKLIEIDPDVRAIVSSGYSSDPIMADYKEYGFSDVFYKGSNKPDDLRRILTKVIKE